MLRKVIKFILYLEIFLLPLQTRLFLKSGEINGGFWEYGTYAIYGTEILLGILLALSLFYLIKNTNFRFKISDLSFNKLIFLLLILSTTSAILALNPALAFYALLKIIEGIILALLILRFADFQTASLIFVTSASVQAALGIFQFLTQKTFESKWLGMAPHSSSALGTSVVETFGERWLRAYGTLPHPNIFGGFLVIAIIISIYLLQTKKEKFALFLLPMLSAGIFLSFSRSAWIALSAGLLFSLILNFKRVLPAVIIVAAVFGICSTIYAPLLQTRLVNETRLEQKSNTERQVSASESFEIIKKYPFFGTGPGNYTLAARIINPNRESFDYQPVHNIYLLVFSEFGLFGFIVAFYLFFLFFKKTPSALPLLAAFLIIGLFDHYLLSLNFGIILSGTLLSLCLLSQNSKNPG